MPIDRSWFEAVFVDINRHQRGLYVHESSSND